MFNSDSSRRIDNQGNHNINNTGNNNHFTTHVLPQPRSFNHSYLYDFCIKFSEESRIPSEEPIEPPSQISEKMAFNNLRKYREIFQEHEGYLDDVDQILSQIPRRVLIIRKIRIIYLSIKSDESDADKICDRVYYELKETLVRFGDIYEEDADVCIYSLMYYAFTRCKLLEPISNK